MFSTPSSNRRGFPLFQHLSITPRVGFSSSVLGRTGGLVPPFLREITSSSPPPVLRSSISYGKFPVSRVFAYCRISTLEQTTEKQRREIEVAGFAISLQRLIEKHISGLSTASERPGFNRPLYGKSGPSKVAFVRPASRLHRHTIVSKCGCMISDKHVCLSPSSIFNFLKLTMLH